MEKIIIAIDGYSACGKSSTAKAVARELGYTYIDSGAMYRAVTYHILQNRVSITNPGKVRAMLENIRLDFRINESNGKHEIFLNDIGVEKTIRSIEVTSHVSQVSAISDVRKKMVKQQRKMGRKKGIVMDGRDIGTVVFPDAELKIFMTADLDVRSERRQKELLELLEKDQLANFDNVKRNLIERDRVDTTRKDSPLMRAEDAIDLDTTYVTLDEQVEEVLNLATAIISEKTKIVVDGS